MDWNPASLTSAHLHQHHHHHILPGSLTVPARPHHPLHQQHAQQPTTIMSSALSCAGGGGSASSSRGGVVLSSGNVSKIKIEQGEDPDDRRPNTPRNSSPAILAQDFGDDSLADDENHDDLLVFGYGCKIFRDDERAQWIENQKHLIPWMGNSDLLIDRYDCRGALMDIARYEAGSRYDNLQDFAEKEDLNRSYEQEQLLEQQLDEERYKELNEDVDYDEGAYDREGDYRKLQTAMNGMLSESQERLNDDTRNYAAFQYNYDEKSHDICMGPEPKRLHEEDAPYVKPVGLYIPEEIILPTTVKVHAIIEKTAKFIASQGNQMEIILKTKQSSNPLFDFLNHGGSLNPYYKFLVHAIRSGIYRPPEQEEDASEHTTGHNLSGSEEDSEHHTYLHPSLFRTSNSNTSSSVSSIDYTTTAAAIISGSSTNRHNAYSMLVSKIKGTDSPDPVSQQQQQSTSNLPPTQFSSEYSSSSYQENSNPNMYSMYGYNLTSQQTQAVVPKPQKKLPSTPDQLIIEKMASYVIKNGANFEVLAKNKSDPRFSFLNPSHEYHWYYLNCKERFKAECTAVVASSDFINYTSSTASNSSNNSPLASTSNSPTKLNQLLINSVTSTIKKSAVAAELAELKRKNSALLGKKEVAKEKVGSGGGLGGGGGSAENVFSQASLVQNKEKEKPVIRFSSALSLTSVPTVGGVVKIDTTKVNTSSIEVPGGSSSSEMKTLQEDKRTLSVEDIHKQATGAGGAAVSGTTTNAVIAPADVEEDEEEEGEIREVEGGSDSDLYLLEDDPSGGGDNSTPASEDDEEKMRRRLERKRKATLFLQKLKMSKTGGGGNPSQLSVMKASKETGSSQISSGQGPKSKPKSVTTGPSLGDLLNRRLQTNVEASAAAAAAHQERIINAQVPQEITLSDSGEDIAHPGAGGQLVSGGGSGGGGNIKDFHNNSDSSKSNASSRPSSRSKSRNHASSSSRTSRKRRKRRRSRSYSSSHSHSRSSSASSYDSSSHSAYSRKKSSKKKKSKKKKKKSDKSSRSSHKSKRR